MKYVLDSCALIAFIRDEDGADVIEHILLDDPSTVMHVVNVCEVYQKSAVKPMPSGIGAGGLRRKLLFIFAISLFFAIA